MRRLVAATTSAVAVVVACSSPSPHAASAAATPTGPVRPADRATAACDAVRPKVAELYRAELRDREPARIDEAIADNTAMVMNDCIKTPDRTPACVAAATTTRELEACLIPLDDEGTEGDRFAH